MLGSLVRVKTVKGNLYTVKVTHMCEFGIAGPNKQYNTESRHWPSEFSDRTGAFMFQSIKTIEILGRY